MGSIAAMQVTEVQDRQLKLLFYQFQNCLEIADQDVVPAPLLKQMALLFLYEAIKEYVEEFEVLDQEFPLYTRLVQQIGEEMQHLPTEALAQELIEELTVEVHIDDDKHSDNSFDELDIGEAFEPATIQAMPHLIFTITWKEAQWTKGITQGMYNYSGLHLFAYEWLPKSLV